MAEKPKKSWLALAALPLFFILVCVAFFAFRDRLLPLFENRETLRIWIRERGVWGQASFVALQIVQVIIFVLPGEIVQVAGGFVFGLWKGSYLTVAGIGIGSLFNYAVGLILGRPFVQALFSPERLAPVERIVSDRRALAGYFLLFVIPGIPKDVLCYVAGMSRFPVLLFFGISMAGRLPGIIGSALIGSSAFAGNYRTMIAIAAVAAILFTAGLVYRDRITKLLGALLGHKEG